MKIEIISTKSDGEIIFSVTHGKQTHVLSSYLTSNQIEVKTGWNDTKIHILRKLFNNILNNNEQLNNYNNR